MRSEVLDRFAATTQTIREPEQLRTYECDGLTGRRVVPALVVLAESTADVQATVRACNEFSVPFVPCRDRNDGAGLDGASDQRRNQCVEDVIAGPKARTVCAVDVKPAIGCAEDLRYQVCACVAIPLSLALVSSRGEVPYA